MTWDAARYNLLPRFKFYSIPKEFEIESVDHDVLIQYKTIYILAVGRRGVGHVLLDLCWLCGSAGEYG